MISLAEYQPYGARAPDYQYRDRVQQIVRVGLRSQSAHDVGSITHLHLPDMVFDLTNGVPLITDRSLKGSWRSAIAELLAFWNGVCTLDGLRQFGVNDKFWGPQITPEKTAKRGLPPEHLGLGSYGAAFHDFPMPDGGTFNQIAAIIQQIRERPEIRGHFISPWIPYYNIRIVGTVQKTVVVPCHGWLYYRIIDETLHTVMLQRSGDFLPGVPHNMIQYAAVAHLAVAHVLGLKVGLYVHKFIDAHIYTNQMAAVEELLSTQREPRPFPRLDLTDNAPTEDIFALRAEHFVLSEYEPHPPIKDIPVAV